MQFINKFLPDKLKPKPFSISNEVTKNDQFHPFTSTGFNLGNNANDFLFKTQSPSDTFRKHRNEIQQLKRPSQKAAQKDMGNQPNLNQFDSFQNIGLKKGISSNDTFFSKAGGPSDLFRKHQEDMLQFKQEKISEMNKVRDQLKQGAAKRHNQLRQEAAMRHNQLRQGAVMFAMPFEKTKKPQENQQIQLEVQIQKTKKPQENQQIHLEVQIQSETVTAGEEQRRLGGGRGIRKSHSQSQFRSETFNQRQPEEQEQKKLQPEQKQSSSYELPLISKQQDNSLSELQHYKQSSQVSFLTSRQQDESLRNVDFSGFISQGGRTYPFNQKLSCCIVTENLQFALQIVKNQGGSSVVLRPFDRNIDQKFKLVNQEQGILITTRQDQKLFVRYNPQTGLPNISAIPLDQNPWTYWRFKCRQIQSHIQGSMSGRYKICLKKYFLGVVNANGAKQVRLIEQFTYDEKTEESTWNPPHFWKIVDV